MTMVIQIVHLQASLWWLTRSLAHRDWHSRSLHDQPDLLSLSSNQWTFPWASSLELVAGVPAEAVLQCQPILKQLQSPQLPVSLFQLGCTKPWILYTSPSRIPGVILDFSQALSARDPRKFFRSCPFLSGPRATAWRIPFNLLKNLLLFRTLHETALLCPMI